MKFEIAWCSECFFATLIRKCVCVFIDWYMACICVIYISYLPQIYKYIQCVHNSAAAARLCLKEKKRDLNRLQFSSVDLGRATTDSADAVAAATIVVVILLLYGLRPVVLALIVYSSLFFFYEVQQQ